MQVQDFEDLSVTVGAPSDAKGSTLRSSHVSEDERMTLASLVNIQKTSRWVRCAVENGSILSEAQKMPRSSQVREHSIRHMGNATWRVRARP